MCYGQMFEASLRRARKQHRCSSCGKSILPGRRYQSQAGSLEGDFFHSKYCLGCARRSELAFADRKEGGAELEGCFSHAVISDAAHEQMREEFLKSGWRKALALARAMRAKVLA